MFRKLAKFRNKKAQNTAEYALLISLVVAGIIAMQTFTQRALQGRIHAGARHMVGTTWEKGLREPGSAQQGDLPTYQYEPNYLDRQYQVTSEGEERVAQGQEYVDSQGFTGAKGILTEGYSNRARASGGYEAQTWCAATMNK